MQMQTTEQAVGRATTHGVAGAVSSAASSVLRADPVMTHHDTLSRVVSTDRGITLEALRVFTYLSRRLHFDRSTPVLQSELADDLGMQRPNVNRAIKLLEAKRILLRDAKMGRAITFRLNGELGSRA